MAVNRNVFLRNDLSVLGNDNDNNFHNDNNFNNDKLTMIFF